ncbi:MAG: flagellar hook-basal body complex protein FliE [Planctomycetales bacterium]|nr:flagellar hook-basal body complex protein FliE [Planctomycetales bacterium]
MSNIQNISSVSPVAGMPTRPGARVEGGFKDMLLQSIQDVNSMQRQADQAVESLMSGGEVDPAAVMTAVQKADLAFRMMMQMRNKMMAAYQEVKDIRI